MRRLTLPVLLATLLLLVSCSEQAPPAPPEETQPAPVAPAEEAQPAPTEPAAAEPAAPEREAPDEPVAEPEPTPRVRLRRTGAEPVSEVKYNGSYFAGMLVTLRFDNAGDDGSAPFAINLEEVKAGGAGPEPLGGSLSGEIELKAGREYIARFPVVFGDSASTMHDRATVMAFSRKYTLSWDLNSEVTGEWSFEVPAWSGQPLELEIIPVIQEEEIPQSARERLGSYPLALRNLRTSYALGEGLRAEGFNISPDPDEDWTMNREAHQVIRVGTDVPADVTALTIKRVRRDWPFLEYVDFAEEGDSRTIYVGEATAEAKKEALRAWSDWDFARLDDGLTRESLHELIGEHRATEEEKPGNYPIGVVDLSSPDKDKMVRVLVAAGFDASTRHTGQYKKLEDYAVIEIGSGVHVSVAAQAILVARSNWPFLQYVSLNESEGGSLGMYIGRPTANAMSEGLRPWSEAEFEALSVIWGIDDLHARIESHYPRD